MLAPSRGNAMSAEMFPPEPASGRYLWHDFLACRWAMCTGANGMPANPQAAPGGCGP